MRVLKQLVVVAAVAFAGQAAVGAVQGNALLTLLLGLATAGLAVLAYAWVVRWSERRAPVEVAAEGAAAATGRGVLIGAGMFAAVIASIALVGGYRIDGTGSVTGALGLVGFMAAAAATEELLFRGILFRIVEERVGTRVALVLTAVLFGLSHLFTMHASLWGAIAIAVEAGGMLAAAYAATRTLWLPIGLHFAWNFTAAGVFGTEVSGNGAVQGLLHGVTSGPAALTGGTFGPEGSLFAVAFGLLLTLVFLRLARRRGTLVPMRRGERAGERAGADAELAR
ncbi:lysostaphin resistance A-like protein [Nonomuraea sp. NPDC050783]|uniref:CPBP family intramembrane glutamic endopeptidase n=1 Tax=Nonomuraea sp. NPDC050783 TaxID=3154634 RepID=UPI0034653867